MNGSAGNSSVARAHIGENLVGGGMIAVIENRFQYDAPLNGARNAPLRAQQLELFESSLFFAFVHELWGNNLTVANLSQLGISVNTKKTSSPAIIFGAPKTLNPL